MATDITGLPVNKIKVHSRSCVPLHAFVTTRSWHATQMRTRCNALSLSHSPHSVTALTSRLAGAKALPSNGRSDNELLYVAEVGACIESVSRKGQVGAKKGSGRCLNNGQGRHRITFNHRIRPDLYGEENHRIRSHVRARGVCVCGGGWGGWGVRRPYDSCCLL